MSRSDLGRAYAAVFFGGVFDLTAGDRMLSDAGKKSERHRSKQYEGKDRFKGGTKQCFDR